MGGPELGIPEYMYRLTEDVLLFGLLTSVAIVLGFFVPGRRRPRDQGRFLAMPELSIALASFLFLADTYLMWSALVNGWIVPEG